MGSGTEVAKEAGDVVILDDNFNSIDTVKVKFLNNEIYETATYLDNDINIGNLISIYGIVVRNSDHLELQCKCGSIRIYQKFAEAGRIDTKKFQTGISGIFF